MSYLNYFRDGMGPFKAKELKFTKKPILLKPHRLTGWAKIPLQ